MKNFFTIKNTVSPLESVARSNSQNSLGSVLSLVDSSHSAVFIFNKKDKFLGLVSPFKTLYLSNYPYTTKVSSILFKPPNITKETPIYEVAEHMLATKIYVLPVFNKDGNLEGVIHAKDILQEIVKNPSILRFVSNHIQPHTPITAPLTTSVREVFHTLKEKGVSRMILVDTEGDLAGIVSRSDLIHSLIKPTSKMRFPKEGTHVGFYSLAGEKKFRKEEPIKKYYTVMVDSLPENTPLKKVVSHLITSSFNSIVLVNRRIQPVGFLSTKDILQAIVQLRPEVEIPLIIKKPSDSVSDTELEHAVEYLERFGRKLKKRMEIEKIEVASEEPKSPKGHTRAFNTTLIVTPIAGKSFVAVTKRRNFMRGIQEATTLIEKQRRRSGVSKEETKQTIV